MPFQYVDKLTKPAIVPKLLSIRDAAKTLAVSQESVRLWIKKGIINSVKLGTKSRRVSMEEINRLANVTK